MKKFLSIFMLCCMCFQCALKLGIISWYQANKQYVATTLCENKDKPKMKCCGKCYLRKQLVKTEGSGSSQSKSVQIEWVEFLPVEHITFIAKTYTESIDHHPQYTTPSGYDPLDAVFHPPPAA